MKIPRVNQKSVHEKLKEECDRLWAECVKARAGGKSELSGKTEGLQAHHIVGKPNYLLRYCLENGICLTSGEHFFGIHNENRRRDYERRIKAVRTEDIYERLIQMTWVNTKVDLRMTKIYLQEKLKEFKNANL